MTRAVSFFVLVAFCVLCWIGLAQIAVTLGAHALTDAQVILSAMLLIGGVALLLAGWLLRHAGLRWIDTATGFAVANAGRAVVSIGALVLAAGSGAVLSAAVAP